METIGLLAAMPQESQALLSLVDERQAMRLGGLRGYQFDIFGRQCLLVESGIGPECAARATRLLIDEFHPHVLVAFGIAGAVRADLNVGDVVVGVRSCALDGPALIGQTRPLAGLSAEAWHATGQALARHGAQLLRGTTISTRGSQAVPIGSELLENPVLEMETAAIAQVAAQARLPLLAMRSISDGPQAPLPLDLEEITGEDYQIRVGELLRAVWHRPQLLLQAPQVMRNMSTAATHAAVGVAAALGQPAPLVPD